MKFKANKCALKNKKSKMENKKIDIIIPSFNASKHIRKLLLSIKEQDFKDYDCFVIDDNSSDNTAEIIKNEFSWVNLIEQKKNTGPSKAKNVAAEKGCAPYIVFFDSDIFLSDNKWLTKAFSKIESDKKIGQLASMIVSGFDEEILLDCGIQGEGPLFGGIYHKENIHNVLNKHKTERMVLAACTAGTIIRRDVFEMVGKFDPKYYYLAEDLDLSLRVHLSGYDILYYPSLIINHYESQAMGKKEKLKRYLYHRNCLFALFENYPLKYAFNKLLHYIIHEIKEMFFLLLSNKKKISEQLISFFKLTLSLVFNIPGITIKRIRGKKYIKKSRNHLIDISKALSEDISLKLPVKSLIYSITNKCNAKCKMCFQKWLNYEADLLTLDELTHIFQSIDGLKNIVLGGGEPFLRNDIDQICKILIKNGNPLITIPTNGSLPDNMYQQTKKILGYGANKLIISLSLDGMAEYHEKNRSIPGLFLKVKECYDKLINLRQIYGDRLQIQINSCFSKDNINQIDMLFEYITTEMSEANWIFEPIRGSFDINKVNPPSIDDWNIIYKKIDEFNDKKKFSTYQSLKCLYDLSLKTLQEKTQVMSCLGGTEFITMDHIGGIAPCELFPNIINIREINYDFNNLLMNEKWLEYQKKIKNKECYCTHFCWLSYSNDRVYKTRKFYVSLSIMLW
ncbi:glycosyltransferase [Candidatus Poribacteria bacterium]|nr:glycosyltransferase [Candidatus Poribacteria bacterium]